MKKESKGCFIWICKCFSKSDNSKVIDNKKENNINAKTDNRTYEINIVENISPEVNPSIEMNVVNTVNQNRIDNNDIEEDIILKKHRKVTQKFRIQSSHNKSNLIVKDDYARENKYNCPICLKYFNQILKLSCCKNYICIICSEDFISTCVKYDYSINCPFCGTADKSIILEDVRENEPIKIYSDPPDSDFRKTISMKFSRLAFYTPEIIFKSRISEKHSESIKNKDEMIFEENIAFKEVKVIGEEYLYSKPDEFIFEARKSNNELVNNVSVEKNLDSNYVKNINSGSTMEVLEIVNNIIDELLNVAFGIIAKKSFDLNVDINDRENNKIFNEVADEINLDDFKSLKKSSLRVKKDIINKNMIKNFMENSNKFEYEGMTHSIDIINNNVRPNENLNVLQKNYYTNNHDEIFDVHVVEDEEISKEEQLQDSYSENIFIESNDNREHKINV